MLTCGRSHVIKMRMELKNKKNTHYNALLLSFSELKFVFFWLLAPSA